MITFPNFTAPNFILHEFVPKTIYNKYGENSIWFLRPEMVKLAQFYRTWFDAPVYINTWHKGGDLQERGYRVPTTNTGSKYSQHKLGNAFDCNVKGLTPDKVRQEILHNEKEFMDAGLTTLESGAYAPTWVHSDLRTTNKDEIFIVSP